MAAEYDWHPKPHQGSVFKVETRNLGWWVLLAICISVLVHALLYLALGAIHRRADSALDGSVVFRTKHEQATIDRDKLEQLLADAEIPEDRAEIDPGKVSNLDMVDTSLDEFDLMERIKEETVRMAPVDTPQVVGSEAPQVPKAALDAASRDIEISAGDMLAEDLDDMRDQLIDSSSQVSSEQAVLELNPGEDLTKGVDSDEFFQDAASKAFGTEADEFIRGYATLDGLMDRDGGLAGGEEKIAMPTDILFGYNEYRLKESARLSMMKLAFLVQTNPGARFTIEGHTDSFGGAEFNRELSLKRAEAVRDWLVERLRIGVDNIRVVGLGMQRPVVSTDGTVEEQALNRRVEIVVHGSGGEQRAAVARPAGNAPSPAARPMAEPVARPLTERPGDPVARPITEMPAQPVARPLEDPEARTRPDPVARPVPRQ